MAPATQKDQSLRYLVHHSDRGSQYADKEYLQVLERNHILISMALKGPDDAYAERINGTIKNEYLESSEITTLDEPGKWVKTDVRLYNHKRIHRSLPGKNNTKKFKQHIVHPGTRKRPRVILYTGGKPKLCKASSLIAGYPEKDLQATICPIVNL